MQKNGKRFDLMVFTISILHCLLLAKFLFLHFESFIFGIHHWISWKSWYLLYVNWIFVSHALQLVCNIQLSNDECTNSIENDMWSSFSVHQFGNKIFVSYELYLVCWVVYFSGIYSVFLLIIFKQIVYILTTFIFQDIVSIKKEERGLTCHQCLQRYEENIVTCFNCNDTRYCFNCLIKW